jgi:predicted Zn-dependent peptidase
MADLYERDERVTVVPDDLGAVEALIRERMRRMSVQTGSSANGLRVATEHMPGLGSATLGVWIGAGCRHEATEHENGVAHFLEHMAFKGTETAHRRRDRRRDRECRRHLNAYTSREVTAYYARVLGEDVPLAMDLLADILRAPRFEADEIAVERGVILQEIGQALDTPDDVIFDWLQEVSYPGQPMGRNILGEAERVSRFDARPICARFTGAHYAPDRMILAAAGAVDHDAILRSPSALWRHGPRRPRALEPARFSAASARGEARWSRRIWRSPSRRRAPTTPSTPPKSSPPRSAAACPRGCSRKRGRSAGSATPSSRRPRPMPTPGPSPSTPAPAPGRSAA